MTLPMTFEDVKDAYRQLEGIVVRTPLVENQQLNELVGGRVFIKPECLQRTGSFKFRGAYNRISRLTIEEKARGVVAFSSGNHSAGVACAARMLGVPAIIVMPHDAPAIKVQNTKQYGADIVVYDRYKEDREAIAQAIAVDKGSIVVPSFDDLHIMAGQGTAGYEVAEDLKTLGVSPDQIVVNCGGGGLASGMFTALRHAFPDTLTRIVEPEGFDEFTRSLDMGVRQRVEPGGRSICDAILTDFPGKQTFEVLSHFGAKGVDVSDEDAIKAVSFAARELKLVGEPGGVVSLAGLLTGKVDGRDKVSVCIISGGNIDPKMLADAVTHY